MLPAVAAETGETSGPAVGTNVKPSTATQKEGQNASDLLPSTQAGAPGTPAKQGSEGGEAPKK
jgi:hypothetical protein